MVRPTCGEFQTDSPYALKPQPYSSHSLILQLLPENGHGLRLLDVGCADGYLSRLFAARGFSVTAIDAVAPTQAVPDGVHFLEADLDQGLPPAAGDFDFVICADILEHLRHPDVLLRQIRPRMAAGGKLVASLPNSGNIYFRFRVLSGEFPEHDRGLFDRTHLHFYMWKGWHNLLTRSGFRITAARQSVIPFSLRWPNQAGLMARLESAYAVAARVWPALFAYQFVIVAESW